MLSDEPKNKAAEYEAILAARDQQRYVLRLYVTGLTMRSTRAIAALKEVCEEHLKGRYDLEVIDVSQQRELARQEQVIAAPTLIKSLPAPVRRVIGDFSDTDKLRIVLDIERGTEAS